MASHLQSRFNATAIVGETNVDAEPEHRREKKYVDPRIANPHYIPEVRWPMPYVLKQREQWRKTHSCGRPLTCEEAWSQP